ncbi:hypothetical protein [Owenweeksia hongkongensis]|uniref:hypothetical protein n=1 Tax=Owenweeksia hongkongensis TaxID=253245 RepID=UPI003A90C342
MPLLICSVFGLSAQEISRDYIVAELIGFQDYLKETIPEGYEQFKPSQNDVVFVFVEDNLVDSGSGFRMVSVPQSFVTMVEDNYEDESFCFSQVIDGVSYLVFSRIKDFENFCSFQDLGEIIKALPFYVAKEEKLSRNQIVDPIFDPLVIGGLFATDTILVFPAWKGLPFTKESNK